MRNRFVLILVIVVVIIVAALLISNKRDKTPTFAVGSILSLSGDFSIFGESINQGALLAIAEAREAGISVDYVSEDDHSTALGAVNAANKLINVDKVPAVLTATVQEVKPIASAFNNAKIPLVATWDSNNYIKSAGDHIFTIGFSTEAAGEKMAVYAYSKLGVRKVAVVSQQDEWSELIAQAFQEKFIALGGSVIREDLQPTTKDFRTVITKIKNNRVEGVYFPFLPSTMATFLKQAQDLGLEAQFMTGDSFSADEISQAGSAAEGTYFTNLYNDNTSTLVERYKARYGKEPSDPIFLSFGYDGVRTLIAAQQITLERNLSLKDALHLVNIQGVDRIIQFGDKRYAEKYERLYKVVDGKITEVEK